MPIVKFTYALKRFFPGLKETKVHAQTVDEVIRELEKIFPGIKNYIIDDQGALRKHVNIFIGTESVSDKLHLSDPVSDQQEIHIFQALSGG